MDIWEELYQRARSVQGERELSPLAQAGSVAAALMTKDGKIYTGVCLDTACSLGFCAERNAVGSMLTHGENQIAKLVAVMPDGQVGPPCGACRELLMQLAPDSGEMEVLLDLAARQSVRLKELIPDWWGERRV